MKTLSPAEIHLTLAKDGSIHIAGHGNMTMLALLTSHFLHHMVAVTEEKLTRSGQVMDRDKIWAFILREVMDAYQEDGWKLRDGEWTTHE